MEKVSCKLTIFEGPDGGGKTTTALNYARATGARYVHLPALPHVSRGLARMYVEVMLPALLGYQDVVMDRCWLSEAPYGRVFRGGLDRLSDASRRMLERVAMRCGAVVVRCTPPWEVVRDNYARRKQTEMLENEAQLRSVYNLYMIQKTDLPVVAYDYAFETLPTEKIQMVRMPQHLLNTSSAGNQEADIVLVGQDFGERKDNDPFYQYPFVSFNGSGCSQWLASQLTTVDIDESKLCWINADQDLTVIPRDRQVISLGNQAFARLDTFGIHSTFVPHPQVWKRFNFKSAYPLLNVLKEML